MRPNIDLCSAHYDADITVDPDECAVCRLEAENQRLRAALQKIADGKNNLGWWNCANIAEQALLEKGE
jgi:hypothetical protein